MNDNASYWCNGTVGDTDGAEERGRVGVYQDILRRQQCERELEDQVNRWGWIDYFRQKGVPLEVLQAQDTFGELIEAALTYLEDGTRECESCGCRYQDNGKPNCSQCGAPKGG